MATADAHEMLLAHREAMAAAIAANGAKPADTAGRFILDGLSARLARLLCALDHDLARPVGGPFGSAGRWGPNGRGPEIEDLIRRSTLARQPLPEAEPRPPPSACVAPSPLSKGPRCPAQPSSSEASSTPR